MSLRKLRMAWLGVAVLVCAPAGCEKRATVTGKVLENGQPIARAELRWIGSDEKSFVSGVTDQAGTYTLDAAGKRDIPVGRYSVTVVWWRTKDGKPLPEGEEGTALKSNPSAVRQYSATLEVDVNASTSTLDLDVTGKGKLVEE